MTKNKIIARTGIPYASGGSDTIVLPAGKNISEIGFHHIAGTLTGDTYVANCALDKIHIIVNGKTIIRWEGDADLGGVPSYGMELMRAFNSAMNKVDDANEFFPVKLPDALPNDQKVEVFFQWNTLAKLGAGGAATAYTGTLDLYYISEDPVPDDIIEPFIKTGKHAVGTKTSDDFQLPSTEEGFVGKYLVLLGEDNGTKSNTALEFLEITNGEERIFKGYFTELQQDHRKFFGVAPGTGRAVLPLDNRVFGANDINVNITKPSGAGTSVDAHFSLVLEEPTEEVLEELAGMIPA